MMVILVISVCPPSLRGDISKWLFQIESGIYVGRVTSRVRDMLWGRVERSIDDGRAIMVCTARNEQHFEILSHNSSLVPTDFDGLVLMMRASGSYTDKVAVSKPNKTV